jgi:hypothetical protein
VCNPSQITQYVTPQLRTATELVTWRPAPGYRGELPASAACTQRYTREPDHGDVHGTAVSAQYLTAFADRVLLACVELAAQALQLSQIRFVPHRVPAVPPLLPFRQEQI